MRALIQVHDTDKVSGVFDRQPAGRINERILPAVRIDHRGVLSDITVLLLVREAQPNSSAATTSLTAGISGTRS